MSAGPSAAVTEWLADGALAANATVQLIAATIFSHEGNMVDALKCCHTGLSLELMGLMIHLLIRMDRAELADKHLKVGLALCVGTFRSQLAKTTRVVNYGAALLAFEK